MGRVTRCGPRRSSAKADGRDSGRSWTPTRGASGRRRRQVGTCWSGGTARARASRLRRQARGARGRAPLRGRRLGGRPARPRWRKGQGPDGDLAGADHGDGEGEGAEQEQYGRDGQGDAEWAGAQGVDGVGGEFGEDEVDDELNADQRGQGEGVEEVGGQAERSAAATEGEVEAGDRASARICASGATSWVKAEVGMTSARLAALISSTTALPPPATAPMRWSVDGMGWDMGFGGGRGGPPTAGGRRPWCSQMRLGQDDRCSEEVESRKASQSAWSAFMGWR